MAAMAMHLDGRRWRIRVVCIARPVAVVHRTHEAALPLLAAFVLALESAHKFAEVIRHALAISIAAAIASVAVAIATTAAVVAGVVSAEVIARIVVARTPFAIAELLLPALAALAPSELLLAALLGSTRSLTGTGVSGGSSRCKSQAFAFHHDRGWCCAGVFGRTRCIRLARRGCGYQLIFPFTAPTAAALALPHAWGHRAATFVAAFELFGFKSVPAKLIGSVY